MTRQTLEAVVRALDAARVRYLIVGGVAVVAHGFVRFTADLDLVLDPDRAALDRAVNALAALDYRPRAPVPFVDFADPARRAEWARDKGLTVFSIFSARHGATEIDLFVDPPFEFEPAYARAVRLETAPGVVATFVGLDDLIAMKRAAGRPQDLQDAERLEALREGRP